MTKSDIFVGLLLKPHPEVFLGHGVITALKDDRVQIQWYTNTGEVDDFTDMSIRDALNNFEYAGWTVLTSLEKELI